MSNHLPNGTVLPYGVLGIDSMASMGAFNKAYRNTPLRMGIVVASYAYNDPNNFTKLTTEYDVLVIEQNENISSTNIRYRNCVSSEGMGSIADFFEKNLRYQTQNQNANGEINTSGQNGAIVILLCLDGFTQKGVIIGGLTHPDRQTTLTNNQPYLQGEYNGVNVVVNQDGSTALTFNGATDNNGDITNPSQGPTVVQIETDGSFQVSHSAATFTMAKSGVVTITANSDINVNTQGNANVTVAGNTDITTQGNSNITTQGDTDITTQGEANIIAEGTTTIDGSTIKLGVDAIESVIKGDIFRDLYNNHTHIGNLGVPTGGPDKPMDPSLSLHVFTE